jgi:hypothetical protein
LFEFLRLLPGHCLRRDENNLINKGSRRNQNKKEFLFGLSTQKLEKQGNPNKKPGNPNTNPGNPNKRTGNPNNKY